MYFGELDQTHRFGCESGFITEFVSGDSELDGLPLHVALERPKQHEQAGDRNIGLRILVGQIFVMHEHGRRDHQQGADVIPP